MNLAIKGHYTRGKEIIKILEMLGGINLRKLEGIDSNYYYTIENDGTILGRINTNLCNKHVSYTIEEFLEKYPYKVGDKVIIKVNNQEAIIDKAVWCCDTIIYWLKYDDCLGGNWRTEHLRPYKEETMEIPEKLMPKIDFNEYCKDKYILDLGNYEIKEENGKTYAVRKRLEYPKTYEECCEVLRIPKNEHYIDIDAPLVPSDYNRLVSAFTKLLICRDAYWKIVGEQMGLGKPWEPDSKNKVYYIFYCISNNTIKLSEGNLYSNVVLAFPTKEMRDAFYENFKDLIEQCKELL